MGKTGWGRVKLLLIILFSLSVAACMEMNIAIDFKSKSEGTMTMSFGIHKDALENLQKQQGTKAHPFCEKFKGTNSRRYIKGEYDFCEVKYPTSIAQIKRDPFALTSGDDGAHRFEFKEVGDHYRLEFDFDTRPFKKTIEQANNPQMMEVMESLVKDKGLTFTVRADKIIKTSGKISEGGRLSTWTMPFLKMIKHKGTHMKNYVEFKVK